MNGWRLLCRLGFCNRSCRGRNDHRPLPYAPWSRRSTLDEIDWHDLLLRRDREWSRATAVAMTAGVVVNLAASFQIAPRLELAGWLMVPVMLGCWALEIRWSRRHAEWHATYQDFRSPPTGATKGKR